MSFGGHGEKLAVPCWCGSSHVGIDPARFRSGDERSGSCGAWVCTEEHFEALRQARKDRARTMETAA